MTRNTELLIQLLVIGFVAAAAFGVYKWRQWNRVRRVHAWVKEYLTVRHGTLPDPLSINCSNDAYWPVLVNFTPPGTGVEHRLQFSCPGAPATFALLSESMHQREPRGAAPGPAAVSPR